MNKHIMHVLWALLLGGAIAPLPAQTGAAPAARPAAQEPRARISPEARAALQSARQLAARIKGTENAERSSAIEAAARAYEQVATDFAAEPGAAANAQFEAGDLWRRHGSLALAEQGYLAAARLDPQRYGQRGTLLAADMQRRLKRTDEAMESYRTAETMDPGTSRAQDARLWRARLLQSTGKLDDAITLFQVALEAAEGPRQVIEAANWLAKAQIARGDFDAAQAAIGAADAAVQGAGEDDVVERERLQKALESMSARSALQRARDKQNGASKDAVQLEESRNGGN